MNYRALFQNIMNYGSFDRMQPMYWGIWDETEARWRNEGLPEGMPVREFLGIPQFVMGANANLKLFPAFEEELIEDRGDSRIYRDGNGVTCQSWKHQSSIPHYLDYLLKTPEDWEKHYKWRLQPDPARIGTPEEFATMLKEAEEHGKTMPLVYSTASLMGWARCWLGPENLAYFMYDYPDTFRDMVETISDLVCWGADQVLPHIKVDMALGWEDICGRCGPFVSPDLFRKYVAPGYRKIRAKLEEYGVHIYAVDSDGDVSALVGPWLDAGVNVLFPLEVGVWKADGMAFRKKYGKELRIFGHFDKMTLERGRPAVEAELERLLPLMHDGGYVMMPDHLITPGVSLSEYQWFIERWGKIKL